VKNKKREVVNIELKGRKSVEDFLEILCEKFELSCKFVLNTICLQKEFFQKTMIKVLRFLLKNICMEN
jgi:hypothetical protein